MRILSVDGGGYLGLATAKFIEETERHFDVKYHDKFDLFCGTSTGAIIALALASGMSGKEIVEKYENLGSTVFYNPWWDWGSRQIRFFRSLVFTRYSNRKLKTFLTETFGDLTLEDIYKNNKKVLITAFSMTRGSPKIFKTDHGSDLSVDNRYLVRDVALASAAAPTYFPLAKVKNPSNEVEENFCDGGLFANHPALLGFAEAKSHLGVSEDRIRILSLSTPRADLAEWASTENFVRKYLLSRGLVFWRSKIINVMIDSTSMISHQTLRRLLSWDESDSRYTRIRFEKPKGVEMDIATKKATMSLKQLGSSEADKNTNRLEIAKFME